MAQEVRHVNISDLGERLAWEHLVEEVRASKKPAIIRADGEDVAELRPAQKNMSGKSRSRYSLRRGDALDNIIGMVDVEPSDVSEHVDTYLADAYVDPHR